MKTRWLIYLVYLSGIVTACATTGPTGDADDPATQPLGSPDAGTVADGGLDALASESGTAPCDDCEYFPETCAPDVFCPNGPFEPEQSDGGLDSRTSISVIRGRSKTDVWAAGPGGALAHFDGTTWVTVNLGIQETIRGLWLRDSSEVSLAGLSRLYARGGALPDGGVRTPDGAWAFYAPSYVDDQVPTAMDRLSTAWAAPGAEWLWCGALGSGVGDSFEQGGGLWRLRQSPSAPFESASGISKTNCGVAGCANVSSIHGWSTNDLWAVGPSGATVLISDAQGAAPSAKGYNSQTLNALSGVWAASATDAWSVGAVGTIRHYTGDPMLWDIVPDIPTNVNLNAVWGSSPMDVWAVGDSGVVLHFDGASWSRVKIAGLGRLRPQLTTVWVAEPGHVWIGGQGVILSLGGRS
ncbi:hypothetical protein AKJ09_06765 [Labilithrix luteola]|uniref:Type IV fimbrial biogenesis protein PilY1 n=1 Tax=Labilithrix luteola TaxID=1391654 RepID=A0A0K1Q389_9BACT|nr:hypothetical protein [Labilithrix luteola]AKV00102.1 hypothetical protein AKJ09_06765 [Labilithrix luteola]